MAAIDEHGQLHALRAAKVVQRARVIFWGALIAFPFPLSAAILLNTGSNNTVGLKAFTNFTQIPFVCNLMFKVLLYLMLPFLSVTFIL